MQRRRVLVEAKTKTNNDTWRRAVRGVFVVSDYSDGPPFSIAAIAAPFSRPPDPRPVADNAASTIASWPTCYGSAAEPVGALFPLFLPPPLSPANTRNIARACTREYTRETAMSIAAGRTFGETFSKKPVSWNVSYEKPFNARANEYTRTEFRETKISYGRATAVSWNYIIISVLLSIILSFSGSNNNWILYYKQSTATFFIRSI